ncbi:MAG: hypothetical protein JJU27_16790, partial [Gammaproteobacteria bacterium]|nr:hypothetical protein [Gammaproteobacteria bacterium]
MESGNNKSLSDVLLQALESALYESDDRSDCAAAGRSGSATSRRAQAGEAVLRTMSAWLDSEAAQLGELDERSTELRRTLAKVLSENTHETQRGRPSLDDSPAPPARPSQSPADRDATPASRAGHSPLLAEKLAA